MIILIISATKGGKDRVELEHSKTYEMTCVPSEDADQTADPCSLIQCCRPHEEALGPWLSFEHSAKTDQTAGIARFEPVKQLKSMLTPICFSISS